ncbi:hypothetical protein EXE59_06900 [Nocardioides eburneiflavus]|uniref:DUF2157 domain-containing protein n=1 Tax=Nocardioides eburneiflavus TaxID=2518372 RepID=A0A4Z1CJP5_9ACTN|nr:hypothetical protein [Nocardioides eburneiflavus]TGN63710.1 hypothetical protein EXE59_06900 [Nocardioides eburneiflavus]
MSETITRRRGHLHVPRQRAPLEVQISGWVAEGIIDEEQAARIRARARVPVPETREQETQRVTGLGGAELRSYAVEALGYLGGLLVVIAAMLLANLYWSDLGVGARLGVLGGAVVGLVAAGSLTPAGRGDAWSRLRSVLWAAATVVAAGFTVVLADEVLELQETDLALTVSGTVTVVAALLWLAHRVPLQQVMLMVSGMLTAGTLTEQILDADWAIGVGIWAVALAWLVLGWTEVLRPPAVAMAFGAIGMVFGASATMQWDAGIVLGLLTVAGVVLVAVVARELPMLGAGAIGVLMIVPRAVDEWFPGELTAPFVLLGLGGGLVALAVWIARSRT